MRRYHDERKTFRPPFWLLASNFYVLAVASTIAVFFVIWGVLHDVNEEAAFIPAGITASGTLLSAVILRAIVLRKIRQRIMATRRLDRNLAAIVPQHREDGRNKLTIEQNAAILAELKKKSDAAKVLAKYPDGHREAFVICQEYLEINEREMRTVGAGSPRIAALLKGRQFAEELHRYHMLQWAELEVKSLTHDSSTRTKTAEKIGTAKQALDVIGTAARYYPDELKLQQSAEVIIDYVAGLKVADLMARAERALGKGKNAQAEKLYGQALKEINKRYPVSPELDAVAATIDAELIKIQELRS
jgi:hypothetical protein